MNEIHQQLAPAIAPISAAKYPFVNILVSILGINVCTRPTISFHLTSLLQYQHSFDLSHWNALLWLLGYLKKTKKNGVFYPYNMSLQLRIYCDASFSDHLCNSYLGYIIFIGPIAYIFKSGKISGIILSSNEAESISIQETTKDSHFAVQLASEFINPIVQIYNKLDQLIHGPVFIHNDNLGAIQMSTSNHIHRRSKHIYRKLLYIKNASDSEYAQYIWINGDVNTADILTKNNTATIYHRHANKLVISNPDPAVDSSFADTSITPTTTSQSTSTSTST